MSQQTAHVINYVCFSRDFYGDRGEKSTHLKTEVTGQILKTDEV